MTWPPTEISADLDLGQHDRMRKMTNPPLAAKWTDSGVYSTRQDGIHEAHLESR